MIRFVFCLSMFCYCLKVPSWIDISFVHDLITLPVIWLCTKEVEILERLARFEFVL